MDTAWTDGVLRYSYTHPDDLDAIAAMLAKASVCEHMSFGPNTPDETRAYFQPLVDPMQASLQRDETPDSHVFTIREGNDSHVVGDCALLPVMFGDGNYTIGYQLDDHFWRRGFGTRACQFVIWYGFVQLGARRLSGEAFASNLGSIRILETCGFTREGVRRQYYGSGGQRHDDVQFGLLRDEADDGLEDLGSRFQVVG